MNQKVAVCVVFVAALFMTIMDATIVNVALPTIGREFGVRPAGVDSVSIAYLVSLAVFIPVSGWVGDRFGGRTTLLTAIVAFTVASALCGLAGSLGQLVLFRVLQGVGGGMLAPVGMAMLYRAFPPAERVRASAILVLPTALAPTLGPVLGGLFVTQLSWRWVFYVNLPIGIAAVVFGLVFLAGDRPEGRIRFDLPGFLLAGAGFGALMFGVSEGPVRGWTPLILAALAMGVVLVVALVLVELRVPAPMLPLRLYGDALFRTGSAVMVLVNVGFFGVLYLVALFFQDGLGLSALASGLATFPEALGVMLGSQLITRRLYPTLGPRVLVAGGVLVVATSMALMTLIGHQTDLWWARVLMFTLGVGISAVFVPTQTTAFITISPADTGRASTMFNAQRQFGSAIGVALVTTVLAGVGITGSTGGSAPLGAYHAAFLTCAAVALVAAVLAAATIPGRDAAAALSRPRPGRPEPSDDAAAATPRQPAR